FCAFLIHHQQHEVGGLRPNLETEAPALQRKHSRSAPRPRKILTLAARDQSPPVAPAHNKRRLFHRRINHNALRPVQQIFWNAVRHTEDLLYYGRGFAGALIRSFSFLCPIAGTTKASMRTTSNTLFVINAPLIDRR